MQLKKENENTIKNLWDTAKAVLRGKFIPLQGKLNNQKITANNNNDKRMGGKCRQL